ncbi:R3H and coiled-coil domain-containing protein 1 [Larimichthys crocea]|uniref:Uncharacterized protein n=1 Tax=Larimichthys crocea TaxID=215358 RepID=A0ACD3RGV1_LARCR|nr:R3H and coiled-coil domain-containing protein 1 [Larimichthys crocea]
MPRAARERLSLQNSQDPQESKSYPVQLQVAASAHHLNLVPVPKLKTTQSLHRHPRREHLPSVVDSVVNHVADSPALCAQVLTLHEAEPLVWDQTQTCFAVMSLEEDEKDKEALASVACSDVTEEIKAQLKEAVSVSIEHAHNDYTIYVNVCVNINPDEFRHVIEIYDFPPLFKTDDLLDAFTEYSDGGMKIKWVDNTHALGVFSSESAATHALSICHPLLKTRTLADGSKTAKGKAMRSGRVYPASEGTS